MKTPFEKAGFTADDLLTLKYGVKHFYFKQGDTFQIQEDDGTDHPFFFANEEYPGGVAVSVSKITAASQAPAADADGWIEWAGGECPVPVDASVEVKFRNGETHSDRLADEYDWTHGYDHSETNGADVIAYRLHQPQDANTRANDDRLAQDVKHIAVDDGRGFGNCVVADAVTGKPVDEADLNECIGQAPVQEWDGQGVPPVGTKVERREGARWYPGLITAVGEQLIIIKDRRGNEESYDLECVEIRPANFARDELAVILEQSADKHRNYKDLFKLTAADLLAAGYRKQ